ncbi:putative transposase [Jezberella montanilacus]|uniref:Putative transposase n=1 Tax=Jezberella montanilacus TaxID=323426 RepID=A0A2T0XHE4_9BURK|nr:hypothetical protein [Jezberella montanilacus]PRY98379.1 putative transposase [Jezberella montanilacus]
MARLARLYAPGIAQLAFASFSADLLHGKLLTATVFTQIQGWLAEASQRFHVPVHGWCIDHDGIGLLATPQDDRGLGRLMQSVGRNLASRLVQGAVFAGRYHSCLIQSDRWVVPSLVWLESRAFSRRAFIPADPWPWSSAAVHIGLQPPAWHNPHSDYWACGNTPFDRQAEYRQRLVLGNTPKDSEAIEAAVRGQWALGDKQFLSALSLIANRRPTALSRGRPKKTGPPNLSR